MIFVTGGTGLVGSHLLYELTSSGREVKAIKRKSSDLNQVKKIFSYYTEDSERLFDQIEWVDGDILDYFSLEKLLHGVKEIYHCAAVVSFQTRERIRMICNNVEGTANLVNAALENGVGKICHVSSIAALGRLPEGQPVDEETSWIPTKKVTGYSESKFFSEAEIWRGIEEGLDAVIINPSIILGPGNWENGSPRLFKTVWDGLHFYTKGVTGFVDVHDVVSAMIRLMEPDVFEKVKNQRYLLNAANLSYRELFAQIAGELGRPAPKYYASDMLLQMVWRAASVMALISGKPSPVTREAVASSNTINRFDGSKIIRLLDFEYLPVQKSIKHTAGFFRADQK